jgi:hypothetical protein
VRLSALLATLTFLTLAFAGCSDGGGDGDGKTSSSTSTSQASSSSSSGSASKTSSGTASSTATGTGSASNAPPTGSISATVNGTNATFTLSGTDPDGDELSWELAFGDGTTEDGTVLPATVNHTYAAGNYTVNFTVTDGQSPVTYDVNVTAGTAGGSGGPIQTASLSWQVGVSDLGAISEFFLCTDGPSKGVTHETFDADPATFGKAFMATIETAEGGASVQDWSLLFADPAACAYTSFDGTGAGPIAGIVPPGHTYVLVIATGGATPTVTYTAG